MATHSKESVIKGYTMKYILHHYDGFVYTNCDTIRTPQIDENEVLEGPFNPPDFYPSNF